MAFELQLNEEDYKTILQNRFNSDAVQFVSYKTRIPRNALGFMGDHGLLDLTYETAGVMSTETFFLKISAQQSQHRANIARERNVYVKEIFFYDYLLREFKKLGIDTSFAPACYLCKGNHTFVMENLVDKGFQISTEGTFNLEEIKVSLNTLAKFHGASFLYDAKKTKQLGRPYELGREFPDEFKENIFAMDEPMHFTARILKTTLEILVNTAEDLPRNGKINEFRNRIQQMDWYKILWEDSKFRKACGHGDLWRNNIFISPAAQKACLVDFQTVRYFYPSMDILLLLYQNTDGQFRGKYEKDLLKYYYAALSDVIHKHGFSIVDMLTHEEYYESLHRVELLARVNTFHTITLARLPTEGLAEILENEDELWKNTNVFAKIVKKFYENDPVYRQILQDYALEVFNTMFGIGKYR